MISLRSLYFSPLGIFLSFLANILRVFTQPFMVYGYWNRPTKSFRRSTRISSSACLLEKEKINISDNCWVWHHSILDGSNGITIGEGVQIGAWVGIFTHSSHVAIRLHGSHFISVDRNDRLGYSRGSVHIGDYTFVGAGSYILPGVSIGKGCIISAKSIVKNSIPDFSIVAGNPAVIIGDVRNMDKRYFDHVSVQDSYFDRNIIDSYLKDRSKAH